MNKIIILRGNCCSGKTTASKELQRRLGRGTLLVPQDTARRDMLWVKDTPGNQSIDLLKHLIDYGHKKCKYTILEGILYSDYYNDLFEHIAKIFKGQVFAYYVDAPFDETVKRQKMRTEHNKFGEEEMRAIWREKDYLPNIKETIVDSVAMSSTEIVEKICDDINAN